MRAVIFVLAATATAAYAQSPPPPDMPINAPAPSEAPSPPPAPPPADMPINAPAPPDGHDAQPPPVPAAAPVPAPEAEAAPASPPAPAPAPEAPAPKASTNKDTAWLFVGGALTFVTAGIVLAYSTSSTEQDVKDLYATLTGGPATFDEQTQQRYEELMDEGHRYEVLSWTSFGLAAACAAGAAVFFVRASHESDVSVTPVATPTTAGVNVRLSF